jgi:acetyl-CoA carboxylase biotin carboxyl carrier protein
MAKPVENEEKGESFDLDKFRKLLQLMEKFDVSEVNLQNDEESWKIRRGPRYAQPSFAPQQYAPAPMMQAAPAAAPVPTAAPAAAAPAAPVGVTINAPTVGTFYSAASPEDPPFVSVGTVVKADTVICIIEAMKVFNQIQAEKSGRIVEILVENGDAVGFNQPLFRIEPA